MRTATGILTLLMTAWACHSQQGRTAEPLVVTGAIKAVTVPDWKSPEPDARGKPYPVPATKWEKRPVLWGWTCELPDGSGLAFGGINQVSDDGLAHTSILDAGQWKPTNEDLRKANPLQKRFEQVCDLRNACKDTLAKARHIYFEGKTADDEAKLIKADIDPGIEKLAKDLAALNAELRRMGNVGEYEAGQIKFALKHLEAAAGHIKPFGALTTPEQMAAVRRGQIELEVAGEAFDAEPPPRALCRIAFEPKTKLFVIFGGEHMDYNTNDLWVYDRAKRRWFQRHPETAPAPRADHQLDALGDGRIAMRGGYCDTPARYASYTHVGPERWFYDVEKNAWSADGHQEKTLPADTRTARYWPPAMPEQYMAGARPDAAANEAKLKAIPVNTWVKRDTPIGLGWHRDWGTWVYDSDRDMLYVWAGGHVAYPGNDVARYHLASDRWEMSDPIALPLGCIGTNEQYPNGFDFNRRPWCRKHVWNAQAYDPALTKMIMAGANDAQVDPYFYLYDPDKADWTSRHKGAGVVVSSHVIQLRNTKHGMLAWYGPAWLLDAKTLEWKSVGAQGKMPGAGVDSSGLVYDPKRDRMLFVTCGGYAKPYDGQIYSLDMTTLKAGPLDPEGMDPSKSWGMFLREAAYHPGSDMFLWNSLLTKGGWDGKPVPDMFPAYDAAKNRWVAIRIPGGFKGGVSSGMVYDAKRDLFWAGDAGSDGGVWVLRLDPAKAELMPLKDLVPATAAEKK